MLGNIIGIQFFAKGNQRLFVYQRQPDWCYEHIHASS